MSRQFIDWFIKLYESEPRLRCIKSKDYHAGNKKDTACAQLVIEKREIEPKATNDT